MSFHFSRSAVSGSAKMTLSSSKIILSAVRGLALEPTSSLAARWISAASLAEGASDLSVRCLSLNSISCLIFSSMQAPGFSRCLRNSGSFPAAFAANQVSIIFVTNEFTYELM